MLQKAIEVLMGEVTDGLMKKRKKGVEEGLTVSLKEGLIEGLQALATMSHKYDMRKLFEQ